MCKKSNFTELLKTVIIKFGDMMDSMINLGILAHVDAGKTTLSEQLLFHCGEIRQLGNVDEGNTQTDWLEVERTRGISVKSATTELHFKDCLINLIDTPGHLDFMSEVEQCLRVLDLAVLIISAIDGIQPQTEILLNALRRRQVPFFVFINKVDREGCELENLIGALRLRYMHCFLEKNRFSRDSKEDMKEIVPMQISDSCIEEIITLSGNDDLLNYYLSGEKLDSDLLKTEIGNLFLMAKLVPVICGSAKMDLGIDCLLSCIIEYSNYLKQKEKTDELSGLVFKVEHDEQFGKIAYTRLFSGQLKARDSVYIRRLNVEEKITQIRKYNGKRSRIVDELIAGDIAVLCGLHSVKAGDVLGKEEIPDCSLADPLMRMQVIPEHGYEEYPKLISAVEELACENSSLAYDWNQEKKELHLSMIGFIQAEILQTTLQEKYKICVQFGDPSVIYKETPGKVAEGYEAYTMPKPCWAIVRLLVEPLPLGSGVVFESRVKDRDILQRYQNHIETAVYETVRQGIYGWEVTDMKVTLIGGQHHLIHTHPLDFFLATPIALMRALTEAQMKLLEPIMRYEITIEEKFAGKVIGELVRSRGIFESQALEPGKIKLIARVPLADSMKLPITIAAMTAGTAIVASKLEGYQECPMELGKNRERDGVNPLDRSKWILTRRNAIQ